jgi:uncharacterized protein YndB with AHSA1/START domain
MADDVSVTAEINAPAERVWAMVADLGRMGEWSPENDGATWRNGATSAVPGARFTGSNHNGSKRWRTLGTILESEPGRVLSFRVTAVGQKVSVWRFRFEPTGSGCSVTETWIDERNALVKAAGRWVSGVADRTAHNRVGMERTLASLKAAAEA